MDWENAMRVSRIRDADAAPRTTAAIAVAAILIAALGFTMGSGSSILELTPEESARLEAAVLREAVAAQEVEIHRLRMEAARTRLAQVRGEARAVLASICVDKCNPDAVVIASDFKTLEVQP